MKYEMTILLGIFSLGYFIQHFASVLFIRMINKKRNIQDLSLETQVMYFIGALMRVLYVKDTALLEFTLQYIELALQFGLSFYVFYLFYKFRQNYLYFRHARFHVIENKLISYRTIIPICMILSFFFHPGSKNEYYFSFQMFVSMSMFIEACALLPQLYICRKVGQIEGDLTSYLVAMGFSRLTRMIFWIMNYMRGERFVYLILADVIHTLIIGEVMYLWMVNKKKGVILV